MVVRPPELKPIRERIASRQARGEIGGLETEAGCPTTKPTTDSALRAGVRPQPFQKHLSE